MNKQVAIIHGWSDTSKSFGELAGFLGDRGYPVAEIWLGDYVSMDDDVRVEDVARRMETVLRQALADGVLRPGFSLIVHSTGGLVARQWASTFYPDGVGCPARRLIMLAPANFGSRLAALGKSMIGRVAKGWNNWFQSGEQMLKALELASPFQWRLSLNDLFDVEGDGSPGPYGFDRLMPFVISGSRAYARGLRTIVNENGSDGTVRGCAANLNAVGMTIDFSIDASRPEVSMWKRRHAEDFPFALLPDRDHGAVAHPVQESGAKPVFSRRCGELILQALGCDEQDDYRRLAAEWGALTRDTAELGAQNDEDDGRIAARFDKDAPKPQALHPHMQAIVQVVDDDGLPVPDYFLEFFSPDLSGTRDSEVFHREVLTHVHTNTTDPSRRCFYMDHEDLHRLYYQAISNPAKRELAVSLSAARLGENIRYFDSTREGARGYHVIHRATADGLVQPNERLFRNRTHFLKVIIPRRSAAKVFTLRRS